MRFHASCAARPAPRGGHHAVLLLGAAGSGKSDLLIRLLDRGFVLVADDQVIVKAGQASAPATLAGMLEVRGLGLFRRPFLPAAALRLVVRLGTAERLPMPEIDPGLNLPVVHVDPAAASAPERVALALDAATGVAQNIVGAFTA